MKNNSKLHCIILIAWIMLIPNLTVLGQIYEKYWQIQKQAFSATSDFECQASLKYCDELLTIAPNHPILNYLEARLNAQLGNNDIALSYLKKAAQLGYTSNIRWLKIHPMNDPAFNVLREMDSFQEIIGIMKASDKAIHKSKIAFVLKDKSLGTEGICYDPAEKMFYLGCDFKIIKVDSLGNSTSFTDETNEDGLGWVNGIHIDPIRKILWACSNDETKAEIFKYDLTTGKLIKKYSFPVDGLKRMFNDLVIHPNGDIFITGTALYKIPKNTDSLELLLEKSIGYSNGITLSDDGQLIYVANPLGIFKIFLKTKKTILLKHGKEFHTYGIDGLYFLGNKLYMIQNELLTQVCSLSLNEDATHLVNCEIFEKNTDDLRAPTTGIIVEDYFYFIADSQGKGSKKKGVVVMTTSLK